ncbi:TPA: DUF1919 domain-containing protein [Proteus mirabilis]|uniref:DUF1919 domain-containing protein n=1 Tax=Proteus mirabilis TaxID=584 RepID=UPI0018C507A0|nr:DUF1919 domain-containing protein [Proteus mirabilis]MBG3098711.1 DUF1919 domain-containing protein [Proteus mirabilis]WOC48702.1 DUF1919 domain-containing protein [Proteus mirabilis]WOS05171.1 DUF1919 domain-containing protein [Proteus mirabilis]
MSLSSILSKLFLSDFLDSIFLKNKEICIISNNCWGFRLYNILNKKYNTPFVGLFIKPNDFLFILNNLDLFINDDLKMSDFKESHLYPIANFHNCEIHFLHYHSINECIEKWNRRKGRLKNYIDKFGIENIIPLINRLPYKKKIFFSKTKCFFLQKNGVLIDGNTLFNLRFFYYRKYLKIFNHL